MYKDFEELKENCQNCKKCRLHETRTNLVFGTGNPKSDVLFIGEGPGEQEDLQGKAFVGRSGKLLDLYLNGIGLNRDENVYIANIVKCRPPENRDPKQEEQDCCMEWLREQVRLMRPKIIVCLGRIAACKIISPQFKVTIEHGKLYERNGVFLMGTFHPAALLRDPRRKEDALNDFLIIRQKLDEIKSE